MADEDTPESIMAQAEALIQQVQRDLEAPDVFYRSLGLDPQKVRATLAEQLTPELRAQAQQQFENDVQKIEEESRQELARASFAAPVKSAKPVRRPRQMV